MSSINEVIELIQQGEKDAAREGLLSILGEDQNNEQAWLYMASLARSKKEFALSIQRVLKLNPANMQARDLAQKNKIEIPGEKEAKEKAQKEAKAKKKEAKKQARKASGGSVVARVIRVVVLLLLIGVIGGGAFVFMNQNGEQDQVAGETDGTEVAAVDETAEPDADATEVPDQDATEEPTEEAVEEPTEEPTEESVSGLPPTPTPEGAVDEEPTATPTKRPTSTPKPTSVPTEAPTQAGPPPPTADSSGGSNDSGLPPTPTPEGAVDGAGDGTADGIGGGGDLSAGPPVLRVGFDEDSAFVVNISDAEQDVSGLSFKQGDIVSELSAWFLGGGTEFVLAPSQCYQIGININAASRKPAECAGLLATGVTGFGVQPFWISADGSVEEFEVYTGDQLVAFCAFADKVCEFALP